MRRALAHWILGVAAAVSLVIMGAPTQTAAQAPVTVQLGVGSYTAGSGVHIATERGMFRKYGVIPAVQIFSVGIDSIDAVLAGRTDFGVSLDFPLLLRLQTRQLRVVATMMEPEPGFHKLAVRRGIEGPADLRGKRLGMVQGTAEHFVTLRYLQLNDIGLHEVQAIPLTSLFELVAALRRGSIDAAWVWGPGTEQARQIDGVRILTDDRAARHQSYGYLAVSAKFLSSNQDATVSVLKALVEATDWMNKNLETSAKIIASRFHAPEDVVLTDLRQQHPVISLQKKHITALSNLLEFMVANNLVRERLPLPEFFITRPLKQASPDRVDI